MRDVQDHYFHQAKREGYLSRAAYKLIEINERRRVLRAGDRVLDCGAAPGSWMQVALKIIGPRGAVVGIDLQPIRHRFDQSNVRMLQGDFTATAAQSLLDLVDAAQGVGGSGPARRLFDVIISDMAPKTTGDPFSDHHQSVRLCDALLDRCGDLLRVGGNLVMKVFEGEAYPDLLKRAQRMFDSAKGFKPKASRSESREMFIVGSGYLQLTAPSSDEEATLPRNRPVSGWAGEGD